MVDIKDKRTFQLTEGQLEERQKEEAEREKAVVTAAEAIAGSIAEVVKDKEDSNKILLELAKTVDGLVGMNAFFIRILEDHGLIKRTPGVDGKPTSFEINRPVQ